MKRNHKTEKGVSDSRGGKVAFDNCMNLMNERQKIKEKLLSTTKKHWGIDNDIQDTQNEDEKKTSEKA